MFQRANQVQRLTIKLNSLIDDRNVLMVKLLNLNKEISSIHNDITSPLKGYNLNYPSADDCISHADFETVVRPYVKFTWSMGEHDSNPLNESESVRNNNCSLK
jgi:hypothetical protein